jgi:hypothetical protein
MKVYIVIERLIFKDIVNERVLSVHSSKNKAYEGYVGIDKSREARGANEGLVVEYEVIEKMVE